MMNSIQALKAEGLRIEEFPQTVETCTRMGQAIYDLVSHRNLSVYPAPDLREHAPNTVVVESSPGWRIAKEKASKKTDEIVALAMACVALGERPAGFDPIAIQLAARTFGRSPVSDGPGYAGPDQHLVHPHERRVEETSESDIRMGAGRAQVWRDAWEGRR